MKKFLIGCLIVLIAVLASIAVSVALVSCDNPVTKMVIPNVSKSSVQVCLDSIVNPVFTEVNDVFVLQEKLVANAFIDSVFMHMPPEVLRNVSTVMIKKRPHCTKDDIVGEFIKNKQIYENLPAPPDIASNASSSTTIIKTEEPTSIPGIVKESTTTVTEAPPTRVEEQPTDSYKDTIINGKHALIQH